MFAVYQRSFDDDIEVMMSKAGATALVKMLSGQRLREEEQMSLRNLHDTLVRKLVP